LSVLFLTMLATSDDINVVVVDTQRTSRNDVKKYFCVDVDKTTLSPIASSVVEKLLNFYVEMVKSISVDFWLDLVDEDTVDILKNRNVNFWYVATTVRQMSTRQATIGRLRANK
jgi:hypothetical protein